MSSSGRIMSTAIKLFASNGYHATSMRDIAKKAKIAPSSIYSHYKSKEALLAEIISRMKEEISNTFTIDQQFSRKKNLELYAKLVISSVKENRDFWRLIHSLRMNQDIVKIVKPELKKLQTLINENITTLLSNKSKKPEITEVMLFWASIDGIVAAYFLIENYPLEPVINKLLTKFY